MPKARTQYKYFVGVNYIQLSLRVYMGWRSRRKDYYKVDCWSFYGILWSTPAARLDICFLPHSLLDWLRNDDRNDDYAQHITTVRHPSICFQRPPDSVVNFISTIPAPNDERRQEPVHQRSTDSAGDIRDTTMIR